MITALIEWGADWTALDDNGDSFYDNIMRYTKPSTDAHTDTTTDDVALRDGATVMINVGRIAIARLAMALSVVVVMPWYMHGYG